MVAFDPLRPNFPSDPLKSGRQPGKVTVTMRIASLYARLSSGLKPSPSLLGARRSLRARLGRETALVGALAVLTLTSPALAQTAPGLPTDGAFVRGEGQIGQSSPNALAITQSTQRGVIDWRTFSIATGKQVAIDNGSGATLNRVLGGQLSQINGLLSATGSVYLMNPHGVIIGAGGQVISGGNFVASTREMDIDAFMGGGPLSVRGKSGGAIVNTGEIVSREGGVVMIARSVTNSGTITAAKGGVTLAAADEVLLTTADGQADHLFVSVISGGGDVTQTGRVQAAAVALKAAEGNVFALAGNREGLVQATGSQTIDGQLWLTAPNGAVEVSGVLTASNLSGSGGKVVVAGKDVTLASTATVSAPGAGGEVLIGTSGYRSGADLAERTTVATGASILAGGPSGSGRIETSGRKMSLGAARIEAGPGGEWLLDPDDLTIDAAAALTITNTLNANTNVTQATTAGGTGGQGDITVAAPVIWTGTGDLTLDAYRNLAVNAVISGGGDITLRAANQLTISAAGQVASTADITLTTTIFINQRGADALASSGGAWRVYSANPANDTVGGLTPDFYQYNAPAGATPAAAGDGLFYSIAPTIGVTLGAITKAYDGTTTAVLDDANTTVTGLINGDDWTLDGAYATKNAGAGLTVTATNFTATHGGVDVYGYTVAPSFSANTGVIDKAVLTASVVGTPTKTYNTTTSVALTAANLSLSGVAAGETVTLNGAATASYDSANAGARTVNATFSIPNFAVGGGASLDNYVLPTTGSGAGLINQATLIINGVTANNKVYDATTTATLNTGGASVFGIIAGDDVSVSGAGATGTFATKNVGAGIAVTVSGITLTGAAAANYTVGQPAGLTADITKATLVVQGAQINDKVYDGTTAATIDVSGATLSGRLGTDDVTASPVGAVLNFTGKDVGTNIPVNVSNVTVTGADAGNYIVTPPSATTGNILPAPLNAAIIGNPTRVYDGTIVAAISGASFTLTGFAAGEGGSITQAGSAVYSLKDAGARTVTAQLTPPDYVADAGTLLSNYVLPTVAVGPGTINPQPLAIGVIGNPTKSYDGNNSATLTPANYAILGLVSGEDMSVTETHGTYSSADAGTRTVTVNLDASDMAPASNTLVSNYVIPSPVTGIGTIIRTDIDPGFIIASITGNPTKVYDGNNIATLTPADYTLNGFISGEGAIVTQTVGVYGDINAGLRSVTAQLAPTDFTADPGTNLDNYNLPTEATGVGTITRRQLTAAIIGNPTKVYNGTTSALLTSSNYAFGNFVAGEGATITDAVLGAYDSANAGARTVSAQISPAYIVANSGTRLINYFLPTDASGPGTITKAPLTIIGTSAQNKVYDTTTIATLNLGGATVFGVVPTDTITLVTSGATANFATRNVGAGIAVTATGFTLAGSSTNNYQLFQPTGLAASITAKPVTIQNVLAQDKPYDATTAATIDVSLAALDGAFAGDAIGFSGGSAAGVFRQTHVGVNLQVVASGFSLTGADATNYSLSQPNYLIADITPVALIGSIIGNPTKGYDATSQAFLTAANYSLTGFVAGEGAAITQSSNDVYDSPDAGARTVTAALVVSDFVANSGTDLSNYTLPISIQGAGTISKAALSAAIIGNPTKIYDDTTIATLASGNYQLAGFVAGQSATVTQTVGTYDSDNVGARTVTATLGAGDFTGAGSTNLANYNLPVSAAGAGAITPASIQVINVTAQNKVYDGNTAAGLNSGAADLSGRLGADAVTVVSAGATGTFATKNVGTAIPVTAQGYTIAGADAGNYTVVQPTGLFADITQATISLASVTRVYDADVDLPTASGAYGLSGVIGGDSVGVDTTGIAGAYADKNVASNINVTLTGLVLSGADAGNYSINPSVTAQPIGFITPATLTVTGAQADNKVYDRTTNATINNTNTALAGVLGTDVVNLANATTGQFNDFNVGVAKPVTTTGYAISGADAGNYVVQQPNYLTADITPAPITLASVSRIYTGDLTLPSAASAYTFTGVYAGDTVTANTGSLTGAYADKNVAGSLAGGVVTGGINVTLGGLSLSGASAGNYSISPTVTAQPIGVITPKALSVSLIGNPTKVYDTTTAATLTSINYDLVGVVSGETITVTETVGAYDTKNAGNRAVTATLDGADFSPDGATLLSNYTLPTSATGAGHIDQAPATVIGAVANNKVYDGTTAATLNNTGTTLGGRLGADDLTLVNATTGLFGDPNVGTGKPVTTTGYSLTGVDAGNYLLQQPNYLTADITAALLNLVKVTRIYTSGVELPTASSAYTLDGFVVGDDVNVDTTAISGAYAFKNVNTNISVTLTGLSLDGADAGNYSINASLTNALIGEITPATVTLAGVLANTKIYDGTTALTLNNAGTTVVGTLGTDDLDVDGAASTAVFGSPNVGDYLVDPSGYLLTGVDAGNYILTQPTGISARIDPKALLVAITGAPTKTYDANTSATLTNANYSLTGFIGSEGATVSQTAGTYASADAGARLVTATLGSGDFTATGGALLSNYVLPTTATGLGQIDQAVLTASIVNNPTKAYNGTLAAALGAGNYSLSGFVAGQGASVTETAGLYDSINAGTRTVTASLDASDFTADGGTLLSNYVLPTTAGGAGTITQAGLVATIVGTPTKTYDATTGAVLTTANYSLAGFIGTDGATVTETVGTYAVADAGARNVTAVLDSSDFTANGGAVLANYVLPTTASGIGQINQAQLTASIIGNPTRAYDGTTAAQLASANYSLSGFIGGQGAVVNHTAGTYDLKDAGVRTVTTTLAGGDFAANGGTLLANYVLPTTASGAGQIDQAVLTAAIVGLPTKIYDATTAATLASSNYGLSGFASGEGASVNHASGVYASADVGDRNVSTTLAGGDFTANTGTLLSNYVLPTTASGTGVIRKATLTAAIIGDPTKTYDAATGAVLTSANYSFSGFVGGQGATITETVGTYGSADAGLRTVTANLGSADFVANGGTLLTNYALPTTASGLGHINQATLTASIIGNPTKIYDATTGATLTSANYGLSGFIGGQGASVGQTVGTYDSPNAGARTVTVSLGAGDFTANGGTTLANYVLPTTASGAGQIGQAGLTAILSGVFKTYDGTTAATLAAGNYTLVGFQGADGASVSETVGVYGSPNAGLRLVTAALDAGDFTGSGATLLSNYVLPTTASGTGRIDQAALNALIVGVPVKTYDGNTSAVLTSSDYTLTGFVAGENATITQTVGAYGDRNAGVRAVTASLGTGDFMADGGTLLSNYVLPTTAVGVGRIDRAALTAILAGVTKAYDGTTAASLADGNYILTGFVAGEGATVTQASGTYADRNVGARIVTTTLASSDFTADSGTLLSNYDLPVGAAGLGLITKANLNALIVGDPTKTYNGADTATLTSTNYALTGFAAGEGAVVSETAGTYGSSDAGARTVTAVLDAADFTADGATLLSNYELPAFAAGIGHIDPAQLHAIIVGDPVKTYDGTTAAALIPSDYQLTGFVSGQGATVVQTAGTYADRNAGIRVVTASLRAGDFTADGGALLSNYVLPTTAVGVGRIDQAPLVAILSGVAKTYDGTTAATLAGGNYTLVGLAAGEGVVVSEAVGAYGSPNAGARTVTAALDAGDFTADGVTLLSNYLLPTSAAGVGRINQAVLTAQITGAPVKTYDGNASATLASGDYALSGFIAGEGATVTQTVGAYDSKNAGNRTVTASLGAEDYAPAGATLLTNYVLPTTAAGRGRIERAVLSASITGYPKKAYDGNADASLHPSSYTLNGFMAGEGAQVTQTHGTYASPEVGVQTVTAVLTDGDYDANGNTLLSNYVLPVTASGPGEIAEGGQQCVSILGAGCDPHFPNVLPKFLYTVGNWRFFIPYPTAHGLYAAYTNGLGGLPSVIWPSSTEVALDGATVDGGYPVINSTQSVLVQGDKSKQWSVRFTPRPPPAGFGGSGGAPP
jgi:filamentous hemagglutinin family protein